MKPRLNGWPAADIELLRVAVLSGWTFSAIAKLIGRTRNSCIGKSNRMGMTHPRHVPRRFPAHVAKPVAAVIAAPAPPVILAPKKSTAAKPKPSPKPREPVMSLASPVVARVRDEVNFVRVMPASAIDHHISGPVAIDDLKRWHCRYIAGDHRGGGAIYCGERTLPGKSFCMIHHKLCYQPPKNRTPTLAPALQIRGRVQ